MHRHIFRYQYAHWKRVKHPAFAVLIFTLTSSAHANDGQGPIQMIVPDGQLQSHLFRVFVSCDIPESAKPRLTLNVPHSLTKELPGEDDSVTALWISRDHLWTQRVDGQEVNLRGTLLLFNLHAFPIPFYKALVRVTPSLSWNDTYGPAMAIGTREVYLGNIKAAVVWTCLVILLLAHFIGWMSRRATATSTSPRTPSRIAYLSNSDGTFSLWRTQLALWTLAIGSMVFCFGLIRLEVPEIPATLVALMGLALVTGGVGALKEPSNDPIANSAPALSSSTSQVRQRMGIADLITTYDKEKGVTEVSISKSQMVFWTGLTLTIFVTKSLVDGVLWPVPWELVALMGMSQAGYVAPKIAGI